MPSVVTSQKKFQSSTDAPLILAPAGNRAAFLAAIAAGADAVYCGLKMFSARMEAKNFSIEELAHLARLAHQRDILVYVALNSMVKPDEIKAALEMMYDLTHRVKPDALIIQDLAFWELARLVKFEGQLHFSTLANVTFPAAIRWVHQRFGVTRVVLPRELNIDEIKTMAAACPDDLDLEAFVHGALCYGVSGRCYWSSWLGGKSGLRGRCVQPCRRLYQHQDSKQRFFACQDLSIDVLAKVLKEVKAVRVWKIEGRKKGPHYVFYVISAYKLLRDHHRKTACKRDALSLLEQALGRSNTHYNFLPQRPQNPISSDKQTGSGLLVGRVQGTQQKSFISPRIPLLPGDVLRIGYEDQAHHTIQRIYRPIPKKGRLFLKVRKEMSFIKGAPVFLTDRREKALDRMIKELETELESISVQESRTFPRLPMIKLPPRKKVGTKPLDLGVYRHYTGAEKRGELSGLWLSESALSRCPKKFVRHTWWWLPPVIWPDGQARLTAYIKKVCNLGSRNFILNAPWQMALFSDADKLNLWAGPFCNIANPLTISVLRNNGFAGVVVSPELGRAEYESISQNTALPLGIVLTGHWPVAISRIIADKVSLSEPFSSPRGEVTWCKSYEGDYWIFPNWRLDLTEKRNWLAQRGYQLFVHLNEPIPKHIKIKNRPGLWNWDVGLA